MSSDHHEWVQAAARWAKIVALRWTLPGDVAAEDKDRFNAAHQQIEQSFCEWMIAHYASLHSLSYLPRPVMLHQIPKYMAHRLAAKGAAEKLAVVVIDGLAMDPVGCCPSGNAASEMGDRGIRRFCLGADPDIRVAPIDFCG